MDKTNWDNKFEVGDIVVWAGVLGLVVSTANSMDYALLVRFQDIDKSFTIDGKQWNWHKEPSLKFVSRKDRPEPEKLYWLWLVRKDGRYMTQHFLSDEGKMTCGFKCFMSDWDDIEKRKLHIPNVSPINALGEYVPQPMEDKK